MVHFLLDQYRESRTLRYVVLLFALLTVWWLSIYFRGLTEGVENDVFTCTYGILALIGGVYGFMFAKKWGGFKSKLGSSISLFSLGLLAQFLGQVFYITYIYVLGVEVPYPSFGDVLFLGSVILYIIGAYRLAKVSGIKLTLKSMGGKLLAVLVPIVMLLISYMVFLQGYEPNWGDTLITFFDFGYPIGQAIYVSIALLALFISKDILGGMMRRPIILLIAALIVQYIADFNFSYQISRETWYVGGTNDFMFALAYFLMTVALFSIGNMFYKVQNS
jgi:hypothetical protein